MADRNRVTRVTRLIRVIRVTRVTKVIGVNRIIFGMNESAGCMYIRKDGPIEKKEIENT